MNRIIPLLFCAIAAIASGAIPTGVALAIDMKGAVGDSLTVRREDNPAIVLRFTNHTDQEMKVSVYLYHPYHRELPVPTLCAVRFLTEKGDLHPEAKANGEWWTQYICWSTNFPDDPRNTRAIPAGGHIEIEASLNEVLRVPAGGEPEGWMWDHTRGYALGRHRFQVRFDGVISREFILEVVEETRTEPNQRPESNAGKKSVSPTTPGPGVAHP